MKVVVGVGKLLVVEPVVVGMEAMVAMAEMEETVAMGVVTTTKDRS